MENNLYLALKKRMIEEVNDSLGRHPLYRNDVKAYAKFHKGMERPQAGVILMNVSGSRKSMSPDDALGELHSLVCMSRVGDHPGTSLEWVWEDVGNLSRLVGMEDVSNNVSPTRYSVKTLATPIVSGPQNPILATNVGQVELYINGNKVIPSKIDPAQGEIWTPFRIPEGGRVEVSYYLGLVDRPGFYFLEMLSKDSFLVTPLYSEEDELVLTRTTGTEMEASLRMTPVLLDFVLNLYLRKTPSSKNIFLDRGRDYVVSKGGVVTFLQPLPSGYLLYASYRWQGETRGPHPVPHENYYDSSAIKGVVLSFGSRMEQGDKICVVLTKERERSAHVTGGHYIMSMDWKVFSRDPLTTSEIADHIASDIWGVRKEPLRSEGITIQECFPTGESESSYDDATQEQYFESTISMEIMTEWKRFDPVIIKLRKYNSTVSSEATEGEGVPWVLTPYTEGIYVKGPYRAFPVFY